MGIKKIRDLCDEARERVTYEEVPFGTKLIFRRNDPFAGCCRVVRLAAGSACAEHPLRRML